MIDIPQTLANHGRRSARIIVSGTSLMAQTTGIVQAGAGLYDCFWSIHYSPNHVYGPSVQAEQPARLFLAHPLKLKAQPAGLTRGLSFKYFL